MSATRPAASFEPNVTPMLDVLLVLLVTFMSMTIQIHRTMDVVLPEECASPCPSGPSPDIVLEVMPNGRFRINHREIPPSTLRAELLAIYNGRPNKVLNVAGYPGVRYQDVVSAMDVARSAGVLCRGLGWRWTTSASVSTRAPRSPPAGSPH